MDLSQEWLSLLASFFELSGIYFLGKKKRIGFFLNILAGILWITYTLITGNAIGLILVCSVAFILNVKGYINWNKRKDNK